MDKPVKVTIEQIARAVFFDDRFNQKVKLLDLRHVTEIALRKIAIASISNGLTIEVSDEIYLEVTYANPQTEPV